MRDKWGNVDIWINNAGQNCPHESIWDTPEDYIDAVVDTNIKKDERFKKVFNTLGDKPETVAEIFVPRILSNTKQNAQIVWLTNIKSAKRFMLSSFNKRRLLE